jgi:hypothetical protein
VTRGDIDRPREGERLICPECGSERIVCEREAILAAPVAELGDNGILVLDGPLVSQPLDDVLLACVECATELSHSDWLQERPRGVPDGQDPISDADALDRLAAELNEPGCWNGGDVCELAAELLRRTGRRVEDEP